MFYNFIIPSINPNIRTIPYKCNFIWILKLHFKYLQYQFYYIMLLSICSWLDICLCLCLSIRHIWAASAIAEAAVSVSVDFHVRNLWMKKLRIWKTRDYGRRHGTPISVRNTRRSGGTLRCEVWITQCNPRVFGFCCCSVHLFNAAS